MKLLFKQRLFSWFDSYDIYDEAGNTVYVVKGQLSWGHKLVIYDAYGNEVGMVVQKVLTFLPKFEIYKNGSYIGCLSKEFSFLTPHYNIDYNGWHIDGTFMEWDYKEVNSDEKFALVLSDAKAQVSYDYDTGRITTFLISTQHQEDTSVMDIRPLAEAVMETAGKIKNDNMSDQDFYKFKFIYSILYKPCIFKAYRLLNVQTLCIFPCFCPYEPKQGKFLFSADYLIQQSCGSTLRFPCSVSVNVHCGTDISVSEKFLHIFRCCTV